MDADVGVVGVGTMGSMCLWQLARRGINAVGFEQFAPGHDRSAAGGETRIFRTAYREGSQYLPLLLDAQAEWRHLELESGRQLLNLCGGLMIGDPTASHMVNVMQCVADANLPHEVLDRHQAATRYPQHLLHGDEIAVLDQQAGFLRPEYAVASAARCAQSLGARVLTDCHVTAVEPDRDAVRIVTPDRTYTVGTAVVTAGPWAGMFTRSPGVEARRLIMTWFPAVDPDLFSPTRFPIFVRQDQDFDISGIPTVEGTMVKVALNTDYGSVADPSRLDRNIGHEELRKVSDAVRRFFSGLVPVPCRVSTYVEGYTADGHGVVGVLPEAPNVIVGYGFSGHGFKMSPTFGKVLAELATEGTSSLPIGHLQPTRQSLPAAAH